MLRISVYLPAGATPSVERGSPSNFWIDFGASATVFLPSGSAAEQIAYLRGLREACDVALKAAVAGAKGAL